MDDAAWNEAAVVGEAALPENHWAIAGSAGFVAVLTDWAMPTAARSAEAWPSEARTRVVLVEGDDHVLQDRVTGPDRAVGQPKGLDRGDEEDAARRARGGNREEELRRSAGVATASTHIARVEDDALEAKGEADLLQPGDARARGRPVAVLHRLERRVEGLEGRSRLGVEAHGARYVDQDGGRHRGDRHRVVENLRKSANRREGWAATRQRRVPGKLDVAVRAGADVDARDGDRPQRAERRSSVPLIRLTPEDSAVELGAVLPGSDRSHGTRAHLAADAELRAGKGARRGVGEEGARGRGAAGEEERLRGQPSYAPSDSR